MLHAIETAMLRPAIRTWMQSSSKTWRHFVTPTDEPLVETPGPNRLRILLIGSGISVGYGVITHQLGLGGKLARKLSAELGRGCRVDIISGPDMKASDAVPHLERLATEPTDVVVTSFGGIDALSLISIREWRQQMNLLIKSLNAMNSGAGVRTFILGIPPITTVVDLPKWAESAVGHHVASLNKCTKRRAEEDGALMFVPLEAGGIRVSPTIGARAYAEWVSQIVPVMASSLALSS